MVYAALGSLVSGFGSTLVITQGEGAACYAGAQKTYESTKTSIRATCSLSLRVWKSLSIISAFALLTTAAVAMETFSAALFEVALIRIGSWLVFGIYAFYYDAQMSSRPGCFVTHTVFSNEN